MVRLKKYSFPTLVKSASVSGNGDWVDAFELTFTESDFTTPIDPTQARIGTRLYVGVTFSGVNIPLKWYINECTVNKVVQQGEQSFPDVMIIKDSCYSEFFTAGFAGANNANNDKMARTISKFQEGSFEPTLAFYSPTDLVLVA